MRPDAAAGRAWAWALASLAVAGGMLLLVFRGAAGAMLETWLNSPSFEHGLLVPLVAAVVIGFDRRAIARQTPQAWPWGLALAALAAAVAALGAAASTLVLQQLALVLAIQAVAVTVLGRRLARRIAFPLAFLLFAVPMGDVIVPALRDLTAAAAVRLLPLAGLTATLDGFLIRLPTADYRVAEACAGLRFFLVGAAIGLLAARLFLRSWRRWLPFLLLAAAVPIAANIVRAALIIVLTENDLLVADSVWLHLTYGMGFNAVVIAALLLLAYAMRDAGPENGEDQPREKGSRPVAVVLFAVAATALPAIGLGSGWGEAAAPYSEARLSASHAVSGWQLVAALDDGWQPRAQGTDAELKQSYARGRARVDLYVGLYQAQRQGAEVVSDANRLSAMGRWQDVGRRSVTAAISGTEVSDDAVISRAGGRWRLTLRFYWVDREYTASAVAAKWHQAVARLLRRNPEAAVIVVSAPYRDDPEWATVGLREFIAAMTPLPPPSP